MNSDLKREIIKAYTESGKNKKKFYKILSQNTGLTKIGMSRGSVADMISTLIFENKNMNKMNLYDLIIEESPIDKVRKYKAEISIPMVNKDDVKANVNSMISFLRKKNIICKNVKIKVVASFSIGKEDKDKIVDVNVNADLLTKKERDEIFDVVEPTYELTKISE